MKLPLGVAINLKGRKYELALTLVETEDKNYLHGEIYVPSDYPNTALVDKLLENMTEDIPSFGSIHIAFDSPSMNENDFCLNKSYLPWRNWKKKPTLGHLAGFYINMQKYGAVDIALPEEKAAMRGLGKKMLCAMLSHAVARGIVKDADNAFLLAEADGGKSVEQDVAKYQQSSTAENLQTLVKKYPHAALQWIKIYVDYEEWEDIAEILSRIEQNGKLIEYYMREYGFELYQNGYSTAALIGAPVSTLIVSCDGVVPKEGGSRKKPKSNRKVSRKRPKSSRKRRSRH